MQLSVLFIVALVAGAIGGVVNALISDNGFVIPKNENGIVRPGVIGNVIVGAIGAVVSWGLYGPYAQASLLGGTSLSGPSGAAFALTLSAFVGAILVGVGGSRFLTNEIDKRFLKAAAVAAAGKQPDDHSLQEIAAASPANALTAAKQMA